MENTETSIIPTVTSLSLYTSTAEILIKHNLALGHQSGPFADVDIVFTTHAGHFLRPIPSSDSNNAISTSNIMPNSQSPPLIRFPYHPQLLDSCFQYLQRHVPDEMWINTHGLDTEQISSVRNIKSSKQGEIIADSKSSLFIKGRDDDVLLGISQARDDLYRLICTTLQDLISTTDYENSRDSCDTSMIQLFCYLEDLAVANQLLRVKSSISIPLNEQATPPLVSRFMKCLQTSYGFKYTSLDVDIETAGLSDRPRIQVYLNDELSNKS